MTEGWAPLAGAPLAGATLGRATPRAGNSGAGDSGAGDSGRSDELRTPALRVRLLLSRDGSLRVEARTLDAAELGAPDRAAATALPAVPVAWAAAPVDEEDVYLFHKTTCRGTYEAALAEAKRRRPSAREVLLWNRRGEATEGSIANLVVELDGRRVTPPLAAGVLPGVLRGALLAEGAVVEAPVATGDLARAGGLWLVSSLRGWRPARLLDPPPAAAARRFPPDGT